MRGHWTKVELLYIVVEIILGQVFSGGVGIAQVYLIC